HDATRVAWWCPAGMSVRGSCIWIALLATATAHAEPRGEAGLIWQAPATCPGDVRARIERRLGMPIDRAVRGIEVDITPGDDHGFVARIDLRGAAVANEVRVVTSARCD